MSDVEMLRAILKWSQVDMAEYLGCHQSTVGRLIAGVLQPNRSQVRALQRLDVLVESRQALPGMAVADVVALAIGRAPPSADCPQSIPESA